jgi:hypothetical protein
MGLATDARTRPTTAEMLAWLAEARQAHEEWAAHIRAGRPFPPADVALGAAAWHEEWVARYAALIDALSEVR